MKILSKTQIGIIAGLLLLAMILTRGHITAHLQDASWAIFFLVGFYFRNTVLGRIGFPLFFLVAFAIDLIVIESQAVQSYCFTPSYPFLIPAYAALWFAGRWFAGQYQENFMGLFKFVGAALVGTIVCFLVSNAGFYWFSDHFSEMKVVEYTQRIGKYFPMYLSTTSLYLGFIALVHLIITHGSKLGKTHQSS